MATEAASEAEKMRRVPGIVFTDGPAGRRARIAGTGLDVFEVIGAHKQIGDQRQLREAFHWLTENQLQAALAYYAAYPEEIDERLAREAAWTEERIRAKFPFTKPR